MIKEGRRAQSGRPMCICEPVWTSERGTQRGLRYTGVAEASISSYDLCCVLSPFVQSPICVPAPLCRERADEVENNLQGTVCTREVTSTKL